MLERFPNNLPKHRENVIPADSEKKSFEEVSGNMNSSWLLLSGVGGMGFALALRVFSRLRRVRNAQESIANITQ